METSHIEDDVPAPLDASLRTSPDEFGKAAARQRFRQWLPSATSALGSLSVRATLRLAFACVVAGAFAIGVFSLVQMGRLNQSTHTIFEKEYTAGQAAEQVRSNVLRASRAQTQLLTASTANERDTLAKDVESSLAEIGQKLDAIRALSNTEESGETAKQLVDAVAKWTKRLREYVKLVKAQPLSFMEMSPDVAMEDAGLGNETRKLEKIVDTLVGQMGESAQTTMLQAGRIYETSRIWVVGIVLVLIAVSVGIGGWVIRRLTRQLGGEPAYAKSIASRIANGDLSMQIRLEANDTESLLHSLRDMQTQLSQTMGEIAESSAQVANASREISMGNLDLSNRTEQQANSLEKTTTNVAQLTAIAKRYADSSTRAAQLSGSASQAAREGGEVVANVVLTMVKISESTQAIHANIGAIQSIAFQTNILALNAAVEAAHAGEQGRGFAVVASEVRDLAQRSATAAREISALIENSTRQVKEGTELARTAGQTIADMAQTVQQVSTVMEEISGASLEQSEGIEQMNRAIAQIEETTQQNAALVEEAAGAAQSLDEQAQALDQLVGRFDLKPT
ncbi:MAG TPA: methyl-accepting chemotaxis protein [Rhodoferax sp.]|jgi:methyl-accepting chemotaxis protein|nr:methyl-accepting chemotaxis protein [Rhodoferax sp.]HNV58801.1 methyl-accepting chemotaxis protein [Rhodoferax sp.]HPW29616.1 methyl-accepting chemotaxis protein [Rhodoferax sp.]